MIYLNTYNTMLKIQKEVLIWAAEKGILSTGTITAQMKKLIEEVEEINKLKYN